MLHECGTFLASHGLVEMQGAAAAPTQAKGCDEQHVNANSSVPTCVSIYGICAMKAHGNAPAMHGSSRHLLAMFQV